MLHTFGIVFTLLAITVLCHGYKLLVVFPMPSKSHFNLGTALARGFANAGHEVTFLSPYEDNYVPTNGTYRSLVLNEVLEKHSSKYCNLYICNILI